MSRQRIIIIGILVILLGGIAIVGYYAYQNGRYVSTDNARVAADVAQVTPIIAGGLLSWNVKEGDMVREGEILGRQDLGTAMTSSALNPGSIANVGGVIAEKALLRAPISGQIIKSDAVVGEMAVPGVSLAIIADTDHLYISANIKEGNIARVHIGQTVDVKIDAYPGRTFSARVENIGRATASTFSLLPAQNDSGNYTKVAQVIPIRIHLLETGDAHLMVGMNASVRIHTSSNK